MAFETKIEWLGQWDSGKKKHVKPYVTCATELATTWIDQVGIPTNICRRAVRLELVGDDHESSGSCKGDDAITLSLRDRDARHRKLGKIHHRIPPVTLHEFIHCLRYERFPREGLSLAEYAASEGLAYMAESMFEAALLGDEAQNVVSHIPEISPRLQQALLDQLLLEGGGFAPINDLDDEYVDAWFSPLDTTMYTTRLEVIGVNAVAGCIANGMPIQALIDAPPEEIFGQAA